MAAINSQVTALLGVGADAMDNLFDVYIDALPAALAGATGFDAKALAMQVRLRVSGFEPPQFKTKLYDVKYKTISIRRPAPIIEGTREFKLTFRLDAYYDVYLFLTRWRNLVNTPASGYASNALTNGATPLTGTVKVDFVRSPISQLSDATYSDKQGISVGQVEGTSGAGMGTYTYYQAWPSDVEEPKFKTGSGEFQTVTATFQFGAFDDPSIDTNLTYGSLSAPIPPTISGGKAV
jgi:hypothetical protein